MTDQPFTGPESIAQLRGAVAALRDYADTLGVDSTFDHDGEWWDGYRQAQRGFILQTNRRIKELEAKLEVAIVSYTADDVPLPISAQTLAKTILGDYMGHHDLYRYQPETRGWTVHSLRRCKVDHGGNPCFLLNIEARHFLKLMQTTTTHVMRTDFVQAILKTDDGQVFSEEAIDGETIKVVTVCFDALEALAYPVKIED